MNPPSSDMNFARARAVALAQVLNSLLGGDWVDVLEWTLRADPDDEFEMTCRIGLCGVHSRAVTWELDITGFVADEGIETGTAQFLTVSDAPETCPISFNVLLVALERIVSILPQDHRSTFREHLELMRVE